MSDFEIQVTPLETEAGSFRNLKENLHSILLNSEFMKVNKIHNIPRSDSLRLISFKLLPAQDKTTEDALSSNYQAIFYDYTNDRSLIIDGNLDDKETINVVESSYQPLPDWEEFQAAVEILRKHPDFGAALTSKALQPYRPMPPLNYEPMPNGSIERMLMVGLMPKNNDYKHEIVGIKMASEKVVRFEKGAPAGSTVTNLHCGPPNANQPTTRSDSGQYRVVISEAGTELWNFTAIRPAASSGTNGSGIELISVKYRGKLVLGRAHVPILNVLYAPGGHGCGPAYRDWQDEEGMIRADGEDVAPGFRRCSTPAQTIFETGSDSGNFLGVAIYAAGNEVVLVSELEAGWYRYVSEWRFDRNGTIRPRFGFAGIENDCVCFHHNHHVYWRFDFDIRTADNNRVKEFNDPALSGGSNFHTIEFETRREKLPERKRHWLVENTETGEGYLLLPSENDGRADSPFGVGDFWVLRNRGTSEFDDRQGFTTNPTRAMAQIDRFINQESVSNHDIVVWYAGHFLHDENDLDETPHIVGPVLKPVNW